MRSDAGYATAQAVYIMLFIAAALGAVALFLGSVRRPLEVAARKAAQEKAALGALVSALADLDAASADGADSSHDGTPGSGAAGIRVAAQDISSRINPNFLSTDLLARSQFSVLLARGETPRGFAAYRRGAGLTLDPHEGYAGFFSRDAMARYLTLYSYASPALDDAVSLALLYAQATGERGGSAIALGRIAPLAWTGGSVNVNSADFFVLSSLLSYPPLEVVNSQEKAFAIMEAREHGEVREDRLVSILGVPPGAMVLSAVGVRTWFWEITIETDGARYRAVARGVPDRLVERGGKRVALVSFEREER